MNDLPEAVGEGRKSKKELYAEFLKSKFWRNLSLTKIHKVRKCEDCGCKKRKYLQSHHIRYPEDWYLTTLDDLKVLCVRCHRRVHGLSGRPPRKANGKRISAKKFAKVRARINKINRSLQTEPITLSKPNWVDYGRMQQERFTVSPLSKVIAGGQVPTEKEESTGLQMPARQTKVQSHEAEGREGVKRGNPFHFAGSNPATAALQH